MSEPNICRFCGGSGEVYIHPDPFEAATYEKCDFCTNGFERPSSRASVRHVGNGLEAAVKAVQEAYRKRSLKIPGQ